jgi:type II restriction/modification system DNA methylase subunit YeeA
MNVAQFISKWKSAELRERAGAPEHFIDLCRLLDHPTPGEADPRGEWFTFERGATKPGGRDGWADVWKRGFFGWEYKGPKGDLDKAYRQLLQYRESLENPPLLVVSDMDRVVVRTNFTNTPTATYSVHLEDLASPPAFLMLRSVFYEPDRLRPERTIQRITEDAAERITDIARALRDRGEPAHLVARFLDRIVFSLFAEDVGLLPEHLFSRLLAKAARDPARFRKLLAGLFEAMANGGDFGMDTIRHFNGSLFADVDVLELTKEEVEKVASVASLDWSGIDPSIFGTLFERALDPNKRGQLGAHYTSREDIETVVDPVIMEPLLDEWRAVQEEVEGYLHPRGRKKPDDKKANAVLHRFHQRLSQVEVLDPACGSGNFLYVALQKLKNLEKQVILHAMDRGFPGFLPHVGPWQLHGIEVNPYAYELAQMTVWIGWLQWTQANGFGEPQEPILQALATFECKDAILTEDPAGILKEPKWPKAEFIVGNPPFLGDKMMRAALGDLYVDELRAVYEDRLPGGVDLCCYWFEKARAQIECGRCRRAGLLATQGIRGGRNREALNRIKQTGDIFFAVSDREWVLDGANVHVSMVGFDGGSERNRSLDGVQVREINADLTSGTNVRKARPLDANGGRCFQGQVKVGPFDIDFDLAQEMLVSPNASGHPNSDVLRPWRNGRDVTARSSERFIIDFAEMDVRVAAGYESPFRHVERVVGPFRAHNRDRQRRERWWRLGRSGADLRNATADLRRLLVTPRVAKHRVFVWLQVPALPDCQLVAFAADDDYTLGILHSRHHQLWALEQGSQLREAQSGFRYTPSSTFETFPFPEVNDKRRKAVATAACVLDQQRNRWLNPPEWVREDVLGFPASTAGPWAPLVEGSDVNGVGRARYVRLVPADARAAALLKKRTLTNLYNERPTWLVDAHRALDEAVFSAYGWDIRMSDEVLLAALLERNLNLAGQ